MTSGSDKPALTPVPSDMSSCFSRIVPAPKEGPMDTKAVVRLIGALKRSELEKSMCGKRLLSWYETQRKVLSE